MLESSGESLNRIVMMDMMGRVVQRIELNYPVQRHTIQVADLPTGLYQVRAGEQMHQVVVMH